MSFRLSAGACRLAQSQAARAARANVTAAQNQCGESATTIVSITNRDYTTALPDAPKRCRQPRPPVKCRHPASRPKEAMTSPEKLMPLHTRNLIAALFASLFAACAMADEGHAMHHHPSFAKDVNAFHASFAPPWHTRPSQERTREVCSKTGEWEQLAGNIHSGNAKPLLASVKTLKQQCRTSDATAFNAAFFDVHEAFHLLIDGQGGK